MYGLLYQMDEENTLLISRPKAEDKIYRKRRMRQYETRTLYIINGGIGLGCCVFIFFLLWSAMLISGDTTTTTVAPVTTTVAPVVPVIEDKR
jgi:hypothetical protein